MNLLNQQYIFLGSVCVWSMDILYIDGHGTKYSSTNYQLPTWYVRSTDYSDEIIRTGTPFVTREWSEFVAGQFVIFWSLCIMWSFSDHYVFIFMNASQMPIHWQMWCEQVQQSVTRQISPTLYVWKLVVSRTSNKTFRSQRHMRPTLYVWKTLENLDVCRSIRRHPNRELARRLFRWHDFITFCMSDYHRIAFQYFLLLTKYL